LQHMEHNFKNYPPNFLSFQLSMKMLLQFLKINVLFFIPLANMK